MNAPLKAEIAKVPCTIVTGFLGAGKTTLIRNLLATANGRRLALIVNEFGDVGVDGDILKSCGIESCPEDAIVELANGCICCTVADDFVPALETLLARPNAPEHIVIETSGLALPKPLVKAFNWPAIRSRVTVDGVIAVVDGAAVAAGRFADDPEELKRRAEGDASLDHDNPLEEVYEDQLLCADLVVLNKADLMSVVEADNVEKDIEKTVPRAVKVVRTSEGRIDAAVLLGIGAAAESDLEGRPSHHDHEEEHDHDDFDTFIVDLPAILEADALVRRLKAAAETHDILRIKGFVAIEGKPMRLLVQGVGARFSQHFDRAWAPGETRASRLVIIGEKGIDQGAIRKALEN
ncbi:cobalamin biosynthesis protein CobW [Labrys okinawensis]|uniref:cobalamin biosynthesis protein CobW n=1 Tax=Labrys okinawensis TaxID=346911 RepID=UPI0039BD7C37